MVVSCCRPSTLCFYFQWLYSPNNKWLFVAFLLSWVSQLCGNWHFGWSVLLTVVKCWGWFQFLPAACWHTLGKALNPIPQVEWMHICESNWGNVSLKRTLYEFCLFPILVGHQKAIFIHTIFTQCIYIFLNILLQTWEIVEWKSQ